MPKEVWTEHVVDADQTIWTLTEGTTSYIVSYDLQYPERGFRTSFRAGNGPIVFGPSYATLGVAKCQIQQKSWQHN
jgi:hypothetical protein